jgi:tetrapyrrole methylase family protein/MazG family protein
MNIEGTETNLPQVARLRDIVARLRGPDGCPWDREQTHASLRSSVIEEAYELVEAIDAGDDGHF